MPQHYALNDAVVNVWLVHVWQRQARHFHILAARLLDGLCGSGNCRSRNRHNQFHIRINLEHRLRFGESAVTVALARLNRNEMHVRIFLRQPLLDVLDPLVLISRAQRGGDDGEVALVSHDSRGLVDQRVANSLRCGLLMSKSRASFSPSASQVTTLMPFSFALRKTVEIPTLFSTLTAIASTRLVIQASTTSFCLAGSRSVGPSHNNSTPNSFAASSAPCLQLTKYGSPFAFGIIAITGLRPLTVAGDLGEFC